jgi:phage-related baseplate assembly protein
MPVFDLDGLTTPVTRQEVQTSIYQVLGILGVDVTSWKTGAVVRTEIVSTSIILSAFSKLMNLIARSGFLELSEGEWLTLVAHHVYGVDRLDATFATGEVTLTNAGGGSYSEAAGDLTFLDPTTGKTYVNIGAVTIPPLTTVTNVAVQATEAGTPRSLPGGISQMVTTLTGVSVSNPSAIVGQAEETDQELRTRCSAFLGSLSPMGPWDAYNYAARNAVRDDGSNIGVTRTQNTKDGFGNVDIYCATKTGAVPTSGSPSDLDLVDTAIQMRAAPQGIAAHTHSVTEVAIPISYKLWMFNTSGLTTTEVTNAVASRLTDFMSDQPIGGNVKDTDPGKVFVDAIQSTIGTALPEIFHVEVTAPSVDVVLAIGEVPTLGTITVVPGDIHQIAPPDGFSG